MCLQRVVVSVMGKVFIFIETSPRIVEPVVSPLDYASELANHVATVSKNWSWFISSAERQKRTSAQFQEAWTSSPFVEGLKSRYPTAIQFVVNTVREINHPVCYMYSACGVAGQWINPRLGSSDIVPALCTLQQNGLWDSIESVCEPGDRVLIIAHTSVDMPRMCLPHCYFSILQIGPLMGAPLVDSEAIQNLLLFAKGGFMFPNVSSLFELSDSVDCLKRHFLFASEHELQQRAMYRRTRVECVVRCSALPSTTVAQSLLEDSSSIEWRWTRGLRMIRQLGRNIRDIVITENGPVGLELACTEQGWIVINTHPPISAIGLPIGSRVCGIDQTNITSETPIHLVHWLMNKRPLCITTQNGPDLHGQVSSEELGACVLSHRAIFPYKTIPPPFPNRTIKQQRLVQSSTPIMSAILTACVVMMDEVSFCRVAMTCKDAFSVKIPYWRRYIVRRVGGVTKISSRQIKFNAEFVQIVDAVTPACFVYAPTFTRELRNEGVALEILFARLIADAQSHNCRHIQSIFDIEGCCSIMWLRIFLVLLKNCQYIWQHREDVYQETCKRLCISAVTPELIQEALHVPITHKWISEWSEMDALGLKGIE